MHKYYFQVLYSKVSTLTKQLCYKSVFVRVSMFSYVLEWIDKGCKARWLTLSPQSNSKEVCMFSPCLRGRFFLAPRSTCDLSRIYPALSPVIAGMGSSLTVTLNWISRKDG